MDAARSARAALGNHENQLTPGLVMGQRPSPSDAVSQQRLWDRHRAMALHGATPRGGVNRQALSAEDIEARRTLIDWARDIGCSAFGDELGNFFIRMEGRQPELPPVLTGSHLDSQPTGGKFDGVYGVLAGFEVLQAIRERVGPD